MFKLNLKEALSIAGAIFGGMVVIILATVGVRLAADRVFADHVWPRLIVAALIVLVLGYLFRNWVKRKQPRN